MNLTRASLIIQLKSLDDPRPTKVVVVVNDKSLAQVTIRDFLRVAHQLERYRPFEEEDAED
jgi:hypothetical protein